MLLQIDIQDILEDFPPGPLDLYRNRASFNWRKLKLALEGKYIHSVSIKNSMLKKGNMNEQTNRITHIFIKMI